MNVTSQNHVHMRLGLLIILFVLACFTSNSQGNGKGSLYDPSENAPAAIVKKTKEAKESGKHLLVQVGNNGCVWCRRFHQLTVEDRGIDSVLSANFIIYRLNTSPENPNEKLLSRFGFPQRFGYPVFLVLNGKGELIHTQNSVYLEKGTAYDRERVLEFLGHWSPQALKPERYKQQ